MRCDTWTGDVVRWSEAGFFPSEAVFVARPTSDSEAARDCNGNRRSCNDKSPAASDEEDGVLLSLVLSLEDERQGFLLILDPRDMREISRSYFKTPASPLTPSFHGVFLPH